MHGSEVTVGETSRLRSLRITQGCSGHPTSSRGVMYHPKNYPEIYKGLQMQARPYPGLHTGCLAFGAGTREKLARRIVTVGRAVLCRDLCRNPRIPARLGWCRMPSLGYT